MTDRHGDSQGTESESDRETKSDPRTEAETESESGAKPGTEAEAGTDEHGPGHSSRTARDRQRFSRRGTLAALAGLGLLGVGGGTAAASTEGLWAPNPQDETVDLDGETVFELVGPQRFERDDGAEVRDGGTVRAGSLNDIAEDVAGGTVSGGGYRREDRDETEPNTVTSHFGTVAGGGGNRAGGDAPAASQFATVSGGFRNTAAGSEAVVAGGRGNDATGSRTVVTGGRNNTAAEEFATVAGGLGNDATGEYATVTGGTANGAAGAAATVAGGRTNVARGRQTTVGGGRGNRADGHGATVAGGLENAAGAGGAFVAGGRNNAADGEYSFVAGRGADTAGHDGAVVFGDSSEEPIRAEADDEAYFQMPVNARSFNNTSTAALKRGFEPVDPESVLSGVESLDVCTWEFERGDDGTHMGPTAEEFHGTFGLGDDDGTIATVDADGVALAAVQGLSRRLEERDERIDELEAANEEQAERIDDLEGRLAALEAQVGDG